MMEDTATSGRASWFQATARQRVAGLLDPHIFTEFLGPCGGGLTAAPCSRVVVSGQGRMAVSGPEVIETNEGVEEFDAANKALVWSVDGGKNRRLIGGADAFAEDSMEGFRAAAKAVLAQVPAFRLETMQAEQERLAGRQKPPGAGDAGRPLWRIPGL